MKIGLFSDDKIILLINQECIACASLRFRLYIYICLCSKKINYIYVQDYRISLRITKIIKSYGSTEVYQDYIKTTQWNGVALQLNVPLLFTLHHRHQIDSSIVQAFVSCLYSKQSLSNYESFQKNKKNTFEISKNPLYFATTSKANLLPSSHEESKGKILFLRSFHLS